MSTEYMSESGLQITRYYGGPRGRLYSVDCSTNNMTEETLEELAIFILEVLRREKENG
jgi:hypothetical protein